MYTIYRRNYWRSIRKRPAPALTVDHLRLSPLNSAHLQNHRLQDRGALII